MRILIAEDDHTSRLILKKTLVKLGYDVGAAADGSEAWDAFQRERYQVVITDWMMPGMDGLDLCRRIRADGRWDRYTYLIILTMLGGRQCYLEGMNAGADDFMTKPFDADELVTRLRVAERILDLEAGVAFLESLLPTCAGCRRVRTGTGQWQRLERYPLESPPATTPPEHCPDCTRELHQKSGADPRPAPAE